MRKDLTSQSSAASRILVLSFWCFLLLYVAILLYHPAFGVIDDHQFMTTLRVGRWVPPFIIPVSGRFVPLLAAEFNILSLLSTSATAFYLLNALEAVAVAWLLVRTAQLAPARRYPAAPYIATLFVLLTPAFAMAYLRLWVQEKNEFFVLAAFLLTYLKLRETGKLRYAGTCLVLGSIVLYTKETGFVPVAAVGFFGLWLDYRPALLPHPQQRRIWRALHVSLLLSCAAFLLTYYFLVYRHKGPVLYGSRPGGRLQQHLRALSADALHEPLLLGLFCLLAVLIFARKRSVAPPVKVLLLSGLAIILAYATLGLANAYYLLPAYFVVPYLVTAALESQSLAQYLRRPALLGIAASVCAIQLVVVVQEYTFWRIGATNFQAILPSLEQQLQGPQRVNLFLDGVGSGSSLEVFDSLVEYLQADGVAATKYDLMSNLSTAGKINFNPASPPPFHYQRITTAGIPRPGDLLLVTPFAAEQYRNKFADHSQYALLSRTDSWSYANFSVKTLLRRALHQPLGVDAVIDPNYELYRKLP